jgi:hypothetical protein
LTPFFGVSHCRRSVVEEEGWVKTILRQVLITPGNYRRICVRIVPHDQRDAIRPGIRISHYAFTGSLGQQGYIIVSHTTGRAGICFAKGRTEWGRWDDETGTISTDGGRRYTLVGENVSDERNQLQEQEETLQAGHEP